MIAIPKHCLAKTLYICLAVFLYFTGSLVQNTPTKVFTCLFAFRYYRLIIGIAAYLLHRAVPASSSVIYNALDVTAILPTVDPSNSECLDTIYSVLNSGVARLLVVIPLDRLKQVDLFEHDDLAKAYLTGRLRIECCYNDVKGRLISVANKRRQVAKGLEVVEMLGDTSIVVLVDDHVEWPDNFLSNLLAPFTNSRVGGVATWKRVTRNGFSQNLYTASTQQFWHKLQFSVDSNFVNFFTNVDLFINRVWLDFWNFIGCLYLERHNFDITASHYVDEGVFVISGRTAAYRSAIICSSHFRRAFCNESWFGVGPLNADDDNFITRWLINRGWHIGWQHGNEATITTTLGNSGFKKFNAQCLRWVRTTWRSNSTALFADRTVLTRHPWSVYAIYITSFFNFALFMDSALLALCWKCDLSMTFMLSWIFASKLVKPMPHFLRHPRDLVYLPFYILFGYYHSILKLYALFTVRNIAWGSRPGVVN